jgi:hypothetical protein
MKGTYKYYTHICMHVGFEVITAMVMKGSVYWDVMPCSPLKIKFTKVDFQMSTWR